MNRAAQKLRKSLVVRLIPAALLMLAGLLYFPLSSQAAVVPRSITISDSQASAIAQYNLSFALTSPETLGSIKLEFCSNSPLLGMSCTPPAGFDISAATLSGQSGETGFSIYGPGTDAHTIVLSRSSAVTTSAGLSYTFAGVVNPSTLGSYYARLQTFASSDASGAENEHGGIALDINETVRISTEVPPYLLFCGGVTISGLDCNNIGGDYLNFGNLTAGSTASATSQLLSATNAANGFTVTVSGSTMTSGNNIISAISVPDVSRPGTQQFGLNLAANTVPLVGFGAQGPGTATAAAGYNVANFFKYASGDTIAGVSAPDDFRKLTVSYIINIPAGQAVGVYATTLTYICLANF